MTLRIKALVCLAVVGSIANLYSIREYPAQQWPHFFVYLAAILLSSGMKVGLPRSDGTMSLNFPFILLGILQLSPLQAVCLAVCSVIAQCSFRVIKPFTLVQILFNVANVITATVFAWRSFDWMLRLHGEVAPVLAIAAAVYFFSNTLPVALVIAWEQKSNPVTQWTRDYPWFLPFYIVGAILAAAANLIGIAYGWMTSLLLIPMVYTVYRAYCAQMATVRDREQHAIETEALHLRTIEGLAMAIEAKDQSTHRHLLRVRVYVAELGKLMQLDKPLVQALSIASFLHDIGKLAVPEHIINKPGRLSPEEFEKMKIHPVVGADILERVRFPYPVVPIVRSHHEAWDGTGYPDGLKGEEIPIGARLLTVVDCFDALASERPYRRALPLHEAMAIVKSKAGTQFDPRIVDLLEKHHLELEEKARLQIEEMEPLNTEMTITRGNAPGAGFEPDSSGGEEAASGAGAIGELAAMEPESQDPAAAASRKAKAVFELHSMADGSMNARETAAKISDRLRAMIPCDCLAVYVKAGDSLVPLSIEGPLSNAFAMRDLPVGEGLAGWVAESARSIVNGNPTVEANYLSESGRLTATGSALSIPLFDAGCAVFGVLALYSAANAAFSKDQLRILQAIEPRFSRSLQDALHMGFEETDVAAPCTLESLAAH